MLKDSNGYSITLHKLYYGFVLLMCCNEATNEVVIKEFNGHHNETFKEDVKELLNNYEQVFIQKPAKF